ncbi:MAG TPA: hypothetical protein VKB58_12755 [Terriglobales bacterium]|jgi:hypothetical protein|nr:hypothetical protein [Terriglobales bacterium]
MKKMMLALLAIALSIPAIAFAQNSTQDQPSQRDQQMQAQENQAAQQSQMGSTTFPKQAMSGMVSNNGRSLTSNNKTYQISNPKTLKAYDGQSVSVQYIMNTDNNTIKVLSVSPSQSQGSMPQQ